MKKKVAKRVCRLALFVLLALLVVQPVASKKVSAKTTWYSTWVSGYSNGGVNKLRIKNNYLKLYGNYRKNSSLTKARSAFNNSIDSGKSYRKASLKISKSVKVYSYGENLRRMSYSTFKKKYVNKTTYLGLDVKVVNGVIKVIYVTS